MNVYAAQRTECVFESAYYTISLHTTKAGAYRAVKKSKLEAWESLSKPEYWHHQDWRIEAMEIIDDADLRQGEVEDGEC